jgi:predicted RNA-binding Zn-ribbon protein involved in translation (DUF1610 family)
MGPQFQCSHCGELFARCNTVVTGKAKGPGEPREASLICDDCYRKEWGFTIGELSQWRSVNKGICPTCGVDMKNQDMYRHFTGACQISADEGEPNA